MTRKLVIAALLALVPAGLAPAALAQTSPRTLLLPGVTYQREVEFTGHGPVVMHVISAPRPGGLYSLAPVLSNDLIVGSEKVTEMERRVSSTATVAGVNGDLFNANDGHPSGMLMRNGVVDSAPSPNRASIGIAADGTLKVERVNYSAYYRGTGQRRAVSVNTLASANGISLFTPSWGAATPGTPSYEVVLRPLGLLRPNTDLVGTVVSAGSTNGSTAIPPDGAVLQARGSSGPKIAAEAPVGTQVSVRLQLNPSWDGVIDALGGGPLIVRNGRPVYNANEAFSTTQLSPRSARTAVGQRADGRILLVAVDGGQQGYSVGMTNFELALALMRLGAVTASALDSGGTTTMAFDGQLLSRPSDRSGERAVADALVVGYTGVYAPPPAASVLSPNADGIDDKQTLVYRVVRPSSVAASLIGPDKVIRPVDSGQRAPGVYRFDWRGAGEPEGQWRFTVTATDDAGRTSTADRLFDVNNTLASLAVRPGFLRLGHGRLTGAVTVARQAHVTVTVETTSNVVLRVVSRRTVQPRTFQFTWDGRDGAGRLAPTGLLQAHVVATNRLGRVELHRSFRARR